jgi:predicted transcriptional regulator
MNPIPIRLPDDLHVRVDRLAQKMALSRSAVVRMAIEQWIDAEALNGGNPLLKKGQALAGDPLDQ